MKIKSFMVICLCISLLFVSFSCKTESTAESKQQEATDKLLNEVNQEIGLPNIKNFNQKKTFKMIMELCDKENLTCYLYLFSEYLGKFIYVRKCVGYGIPFSAQYTSPSKLIRKYSGGNYQVMPQADPNALYMPTSSSATWVIMSDEKSKQIKVGYWEPEIVVLPFILDNRLVLNKEMNGK